MFGKRGSMANVTARGAGVALRAEQVRVQQPQRPPHG